MKNQDKLAAVYEAADRSYFELARTGAASYQAGAHLNVLWIPWRHDVIDLADAKAVGHALVMTGQMEARVPMRKAIVNEFITSCRQEIRNIRNAPEEVKIKARALRAAKKERN